MRFAPTRELYASNEQPRSSGFLLLKQAGANVASLLERGLDLLVNALEVRLRRFERCHRFFV